jgi:hypothetical protein
MREIEEALKDPGPSAARSDAMRSESWEERLNSISRQFCEMCGEKEGAVA